VIDNEEDFEADPKLTRKLTMVDVARLFREEDDGSQVSESEAQNARRKILRVERTRGERFLYGGREPGKLGGAAYWTTLNELRRAGLIDDTRYVRRLAEQKARRLEDRIDETVYEQGQMKAELARVWLVLNELRGRLRVV
jgi:hypothetical protein